MRRSLSVLVVVVAFLFAGLDNSHAATCTRQVVPGDNVAAAVNTASPGDVVCLAEGDYAPGALNVVASGAKDARIVVKPAPGAHVQFNDVRLNVIGSYVSFNGFYWVGTPGILWQGDGFTFANNDVDAQGSQLVLNGCYDRRCGASGSAPTVIARDHIYHCGSGGHGHCIYLDLVDGAQVYDDVLEGGAGGRNCLQLYPSAWHVFITRVLTSGCGEAGIMFAGGSEPEVPGCGTSSFNYAWNNTLGGATGIKSFWGCGVGVRNVARNNCASSVDAPGVTVVGTLPIDDPACASKAPDAWVGPFVP